MADIEVRPVRANTPYGPDVERYLHSLFRRTGGDSDKVQKGIDDAAAAQTTANQGVSDAATAQSTANTANATAASNLVIINRIRFVEGVL